MGLRSWGRQRGKREIFRSWKFWRMFVHQRLYSYQFASKLCRQSLRCESLRRFCGGDCHGQAALQEFNAESTRPDPLKSIDGQFRE